MSLPLLNDFNRISELAFHAVPHILRQLSRGVFVSTAISRKATGCW